MLHHRLAVAVSCRSSSSIEKARRRAADSSPLCRWWRPLAAVAVSTGSLLAQSTMLPMFLDLSKDGGLTWDDSIGNGAGQYVMIRNQTHSANAGGWYGAIADAFIGDLAYYQTENPMPMQFEDVVLGTVVGPYAPPELYGNPTLWTISARSDDVSAFLASALGGPDPGASVASVADPLYLPPPMQTTIVQNYGVMPNADWVLDDSGAFNVDDVMQKAVWRRVSTVEGITSPDAFFNGPEWRTMLQFPMQLNITLIGMKGPDPTIIGVPAGNPNPPGLLGYPGNPPKLTISALALVNFTGSSGEAWFYPSWSSPILPIHSVPAGGTVVLPVSGYRPDMQVSLHGISPNAGPRFDVTAHWAGFGEVGLPIELGTTPGTYEVRYYRYLGGLWKSVLGGYRPRVMVQ